MDVVSAEQDNVPSRTEEGAEGGDLEKETVCSPEVRRLAGALVLSQPWDPAGRRSAAVLMTRGGTQIMRKKSLGDRAVIRRGYPLSLSTPAFPRIRPRQLIQPLLQSLKRCQGWGPVS